MPEPLLIESHKGPYRVRFQSQARAEDFTLGKLAGEAPKGRAHAILDARLLSDYKVELGEVIRAGPALVIEATERAKSLERFPDHVQKLLSAGVRRGDSLVAIGGGIIQDIACFLAATLLRGLDWHFVPTTLLAQADSCIGSKSSINVGEAKNILGTFTPPKTVLIAANFLATLDERDIRSGIGEMLKVHAIDGVESFDAIARDYPRLLTERPVQLDYIRRSLLIKKRMIEQDEFDEGPRQVMNYGHTFGHAIESATQFAVPHGIAVTLGMDMANYYATRVGRMPDAHYRRMHPVLRKNYRGYEDRPVPMDAFLNAILKDKKNTQDRVALILPDGDARPAKLLCSPDAAFKAACEEYLGTVRRR